MCLFNRYQNKIFMQKNIVKTCQSMLHVSEFFFILKLVLKLCTFRVKDIYYLFIAPYYDDRSMEGKSAALACCSQDYRAML